MSTTDIRSPLSKAKGLGSAGSGTEHWWMQRLTAIANVPLLLWLAYSMVSLIGGGAEQWVAKAWVAEPVNSILLILALVNVCYHASLGLQVVIEDYVHGSMKYISLVLSKGLFIVLAVSGIFSVLKIAFGG